MPEANYCSCEQVDHGTLGRVADSEGLARVVRSPRHYNPKTKKIMAGLFSVSEIQKSGVSLIRADKLNPQELRRTAQGVVEFAGMSELAGIGLLPTAGIRELKCAAGNRYLCVRDDPILDQAPIPDNIAHAVAEATRPLSHDEALEIQMSLRNMMSELIPPDKIAAD